MKRQWKKFLGVLVSCAIVLSAFAGLPAFAAEVAGGDFGESGDNLHWSLTDDGTLTISGEGYGGIVEEERWVYDEGAPEPEDFTVPEDDLRGAEPWFDYRKSVKKVVIGKGVTGLGDCVFGEADNNSWAYGGLGPSGSGRDWELYDSFNDNYLFGDGDPDINDDTYWPDTYWPLEPFEFDENSFISLYPNLTEVEIFGSVDEDEALFYACESLRKVTFHEGTTVIPVRMFEHCVNLTELVLPESLEEIKLHAFSGCGAMSVDLPESVSVIEWYAFAKSKLTSITMPGVNAIGEGAFWRCADLRSVTLNDGLDHIGFCCFDGCSNLQYNEYENAYYLGSGTNDHYALIREKSPAETFTIHPDTRLIAGSAFGGSGWLSSWLRDEKLTELTVPDGVKAICEAAFVGCSALKKIKLPDGLEYIDDGAFLGCKALTDIVLPQSVRKIGSSAFIDCESLKEIALPEGLEDIGGGAFEYCEALTGDLVFPKSLRSIGGGAFYGCRNLQSATLNDGLKYIGSDPFENCPNIRYNEYKNAYYLGSVSNKYYALIREKSPAETFAVHGRTRLIAELAFYADEKLTELAVPGGVKSIGAGAFYNCTALKKVTLSDGLEYIGDRAFLGCKALTDIVLPLSVREIGPFVLDGCLKLQSIFYPGSEEDWGKVKVIAYDKSDYWGTIEYWGRPHKDEYNKEFIAHLKFGTADPNAAQGPDIVCNTADGMHMDAADAFDKGTTVDVSALTGGDEYEAAKAVMGNAAAGDKMVLYEFMASKSDGTPTDAKSPVKVTFAIPNGYSPERLVLYSVDLENNTKEQIALTVDAKAMTATAFLPHFSYYVLAQAQDSDAQTAPGESSGGATGPQSPQTGDSRNIALWLTLLLVSVCAVSAAALSAKKRRG